MAEPFEVRVGRNEATFRAVNEGIERARLPADADTRIGFVCECGNVGCHRIVDLSPAEYEAIRAHPRRFLVVPGHEELATERVLETLGRYAVVEKLGLGARVAEDTDPRA